MRNERLRQAKIARNKKRREHRQKNPRHFKDWDEHKLWAKSFAIAGSIHGARKYRAKIKKSIADKIKSINPIDQLGEMLLR